MPSEKKGLLDSERIRIEAGDQMLEKEKQQSAKVVRGCRTRAMQTYLGASAHNPRLQHVKVYATSLLAEQVSSPPSAHASHQCSPPPWAYYVQVGTQRRQLNIPAGLWRSCCMICGYVDMYSAADCWVLLERKKNEGKKCVYSVSYLLRSRG